MRKIKSLLKPPKYAVDIIDNEEKETTIIFNNKDNAFLYEKLLEIEKNQNETKRQDSEF